MKLKFFAFLRFVRVLDEQNDYLSLTNAALVIIVFRLALVHEASIADLGALFTGLLAYSYKKTIPIQTPTSSDEINQVKASLDNLSTKIESIESKTSQLALAAGLKKLGQ